MTRAHSYGQILKSSALIGGSSMITVAVSIVRVKIMAVLLGPTGVGLIGLYTSIFELGQSLVGLGINSSGVRQIAQAAATGDETRIARTAKVLRRTSLLLGVIGAAGLILLRDRISRWTFGSGEFAVPVALLSLALLFRAVSDGQGALVQGLRRIGDVARIAVLASVTGTVIGVSLVYFLGQHGIVPMLVSVAATTLATSWWYRRRIALPPVQLTAADIRTEAAELLTLGLAFMASAILTAGAAYAIRSLIANSIGIESAGLYQSAWAIGGLYAGFILQAMGSDFYPRLTAVADDHPECNRLVNEQAFVGLLLAGPGLLATLTLASPVITLFYTQSFLPAVDVLRWICLGMLLRIVAWPMGFIVLAKGARVTFFLVELAAAVVHVGLAWLLVQRLGVAGGGLAFLGLYVWHGFLVYVIAHRLTGFAWSQENLRLQTAYVMVALLTLGICYLASTSIAVVFGIVAVLAATAHSFKTLFGLVASDAPASLLVANAVTSLRQWVNAKVPIR